nr:uncharacterized protein LOC129267791 [Lytechinus pictus]
MEQLLGEQKLEKGIFKQLFLQRLPVNVRQILASTSEALPLSELAALAYRIVETQPYTPGTISAIAHGNAEATPKASSDLESQVSELTRLVRNLTTVVGGIQRSRSRSRSMKRDNGQVRRNTSTNASSDELCWYHHKFGDNAHRCRPPCARHNASLSEN